jgi:hypothetical protein
MTNTTALANDYAYNVTKSGGTVTYAYNPTSKKTCVAITLNKTTSYYVLTGQYNDTTGLPLSALSSATTTTTCANFVPSSVNSSLYTYTASSSYYYVPSYYSYYYSYSSTYSNCTSYYNSYYKTYYSCNPQKSSPVALAAFAALALPVILIMVFCNCLKRRKDLQGNWVWVCRKRVAKCSCLCKRPRSYEESVAHRAADKLKKEQHSQQYIQQLSSITTVIPTQPMLTPVQPILTPISYPQPPTLVMEPPMMPPPMDYGMQQPYTQQQPYMMQQPQPMMQQQPYSHQSFFSQAPAPQPIIQEQSMM